MKNEYNIDELNSKFNTVESLLTSTGDVSSAILRRPYFKNLNIYKKIFEMSKELDVFENVKLNDRIQFIVNHMEVRHCKKCGKPRINFEKSQRRYRLCKHPDIAIDRSAYKIELWKKKHEIFDEMMENRNLMLSEEEFNNIKDELSKKWKKFQMIVSEKYNPFYHDLILKTENIIPYDKNNLRNTERFYLIDNNLSEIKKCKYCGKPTTFKGRIIGYSETCNSNECVQKMSNETRYNKHKAEIISKIDLSKYEIIHIPNTLNHDFLKIRCKECGHESEWDMSDGRLGRLNKKHLCRMCEPTTSFQEEDVFDFIKENYNGTIIHNYGSRNIIPPYELDFYIPELKLAIEYDGTFYHSTEGGKDSKYHLMKTNMCADKGIKLIHIFEDEWVYKNDIVRSRIRHALGCYDNRIFARNCEVKKIESYVANDFVSKNHLQGYTNSSIKLGLFNNDELVSVMTFCNDRFGKETKYQYELVRFCNKLGYNVVGGAGKLLKFFERNYNPKSIVSYADRRWSDGSLYYALGFSFIRDSSPNYFYIKNDSKLSRYQCQKHKLKYMFDDFDESQSEYEIMKSHGYFKIYDCGNKVFMKEY